MKSAAACRKDSLCILPVSLLAFVIAVACAGCGGSSGGSTSTPKSMKGYELYSWNQDGTWHYSLLVGTNRLKTGEEAKAAGVMGTDSIEMSLGGLSRGEEVFWTTHTVPGMSLPPGDVQQQIKDFCAGRGIKLSVD